MKPGLRRLRSGGARSGPVICGKQAREVTMLPSGITVRAAGDSFLDSIHSPNTRRSYAIAVDKTTATLGETRPLANVADDEIGETLETLWGSSAVHQADHSRRDRVTVAVRARIG